MKKIEATIMPFKLDEVKEAISAIGVQGFTISEIKGFGRQNGHVELYRGRKFLVESLPKIKLEIVVCNDAAPQVIDTLTSVSRTRCIGGSKISVIEIDEVIRIRTGERGPNAL